MSRFEILCCPPAEYHAALKILHLGLSSDQQAALIQTLDLLQASHRSPFEGLLVARVAEELIAAAWIQFTAGSGAVVWPPAFDSPAATELMTAVGLILESRGIALSQVLIAAVDPVNEDVLAAGGFRRLVDLAYLTLEQSNFPSATGYHLLQFEPRASDHPLRLEGVIKESYKGTLDCPELNDVRDPADVVSGYKMQGQFDPENWLFARFENQDIGLVILAEHSPGENWELVYMGIVPGARGKGFGEMIVRYAIDKVRQSSAERLVLAVDERNTPALTMYRRAGFVMWDRRTVYARLSNRQG